MHIYKKSPLSLAQKLLLAKKVDKLHTKSLLLHKGNHKHEFHLKIGLSGLKTIYLLIFIQFSPLQLVLLLLLPRLMATLLSLFLAAFGEARPRRA